MKYPKELVKPDGRRLIAGGPRDMQRRQQVAYTTSPDVEVIRELQQQIEEIKELAKSSKKSGDLYTAEEVDEEIRKAVEAAVKETTISLKRNTQAANQEIEPVLQKYKTQILDLQRNNDDLTRLHTTITSQSAEMKEKISKLETEIGEVTELKKQIAVLEQTLAGKEELIETLKTRPVIVQGTTEVEDPNRPKMEQVFVDPLEKDAGKDLKSSINIEVEDIPTTDKKEEMDDKVFKLKSLLGKLPTKKKN
jgi:chromosome segregation ATPase